MSKSDKPHLNIIIMGHVDNGKSTTTGHLLYLAGVIDQRTIDAYKEEAEKISKSASALIEPLTRKQDEKVKQAIEELAK